MDWFHTEQACLDYLERLRWPKEFICPSPPVLVRRAGCAVAGRLGLQGGPVAGNDVAKVVDAAGFVEHAPYGGVVNAQLARDGAHAHYPRARLYARRSSAENIWLRPTV